MAGMTHKTARSTAPIKKHTVLAKKTKGASHPSKVKTATPGVKTDRITKQVEKGPSKKVTEKVMAKPKENKAKNPENKVVWKPFMR